MNLNIHAKHTYKVLTLVKSLEAMMFLAPVMILFYKYKGLSVTDFFLIKSVYYIFSVFFEIPAGAIADRFCRKKVLVFSYIVNLIGLAFMYFLHGLPVMIFAAVLSGFAMSLHSGLIEAYVYDSLKLTNKEHKNTKYSSRVLGIPLYFSAIATFFGGAVFYYLGPDLTLILDMLMIVIAMLLVFLLPNIPVQKHEYEKPNMLLAIKQTLADKQLRNLGLYFASYTAAGFSLFYLLQPMMDFKQMPAYMFGWFMCINMVLCGLFTQASDKLYSKMSLKQYSLMLLVLITTGFSAALAITHDVSNYITYALLVWIAFVAGTDYGLRIVTNTIVNEKVDSVNRATILSVIAMMSSLAVGLFMLLFKVIGDLLGLQDMLYFVLTLNLFLVILFMYKTLKAHNDI